VLYFESYIVIDPATAQGARAGPDDRTPAARRVRAAFKAGMGAEAIKTLLKTIDVESLGDELRAKMLEPRRPRPQKIIKRLKVVEAFRNPAASRSG